MKERVLRALECLTTTLFVISIVLVVAIVIIAFARTSF